MDGDRKKFCGAILVGLLLLMALTPTGISEKCAEDRGEDEIEVIGVDEEKFGFVERNGEIIIGELYTPITVNKAELPAIIFIGGLWTRVCDYHWIARRLASDGYVVFSFQPEGQDESTGELSAPYLIDWVNNTQDAITALLLAKSTSIDKDKIGVAGHSCGAFTSLVTGLIDERVKAVVSLAPINFFIPSATDFTQREHIAAIQIQDGPSDFLTCIPTNSIPIYDQLTGPKELITITGALEAHETFVGIDLASMPWGKSVSYRYAKAWFDYYLKNKASALDVITTPCKELSPICGMVYDLGDDLEGGYYKIGPDKMLAITDPIESRVAPKREAVLQTALAQKVIADVLLLVIDGILYQMGRLTIFGDVDVSVLADTLSLVGINESALDSGIGGILRLVCLMIDIVGMVFWQSVWWVLWEVLYVVLWPIILCGWVRGRV